jgi:hypothetical protein
MGEQERSAGSGQQPGPASPQTMMQQRAAGPTMRRRARAGHTCARRACEAHAQPSGLRARRCRGAHRCTARRRQRRWTRCPAPRLRRARHTRARVTACRRFGAQAGQRPQVRFAGVAHMAACALQVTARRPEQKQLLLQADRVAARAPLARKRPVRECWAAVRNSCHKRGRGGRERSRQARRPWPYSNPVTAPYLRPRMTSGAR